MNACIVSSQPRITWKIQVAATTPIDSQVLLQHVTVNALIRAEIFAAEFANVEAVVVVLGFDMGA